MKMTKEEAVSGIKELLERVCEDVPKRDGLAVYKCKSRVYYSDDMLNETDEYLKKKSTTIWGEIVFETQDKDFSEDSLCFSLAIDLDKAGDVLEKHTRYGEELARFESDVRDTLFTPAESCESTDELIDLLKKRADDEKQKIIEEYEKMTKKIYRKALVIALSALIVIIAAIILLSRIGV